MPHHMGMLHKHTPSVQPQASQACHTTCSHAKDHIEWQQPPSRTHGSRMRAWSAWMQRGETLRRTQVSVLHKRVTSSWHQLTQPEARWHGGTAATPQSSQRRACWIAACSSAPSSSHTTVLWGPARSLCTPCQHGHTSCSSRVFRIRRPARGIARATGKGSEAGDQAGGGAAGGTGGGGNGAGGDGMPPHSGDDSPSGPSRPLWQSYPVWLKYWVWATAVAYLVARTRWRAEREEKRKEMEREAQMDQEQAAEWERFVSDYAEHTASAAVKQGASPARTGALQATAAIAGQGRMPRQSQQD